MRFLNKKDLKRIFGKKNLENLEGYAFVELNDDIYAVSRDIEKISLDDFNVRKIGLRIGVFDNDCLRINLNGERFLKMRKILFC